MTKKRADTSASHRRSNWRDSRNYDSSMTSHIMADKTEPI